MNQAINTAIETAKAKAAGNAKWTRAIERAEAGLKSGDICVTLFCDGTALVTTATNSHVVNGHCGCEAAKHGHVECVHRAAKRLVELAEAEPVATKAATRPELIADIKAAWPKNWPPLATELMARFRVNQLEMLADDMLQGVRMAVAM